MSKKVNDLSENINDKVDQLSISMNERVQGLANGVGKKIDTKILDLKSAVKNSDGSTTLLKKEINS